MKRNVARVFDEYLAASARAGDTKAFSMLAARWQPKLLSHAYRLTGEADFACDVVQDAWADIVKGLPKLHDAAAFPAWAYRIVTRRAADGVRLRQRQRKTAAALEANLPNTDAARPAFADNADRTALAEALFALPAEQRAVIALFYREGFSVAEIAAALSVPAGTVKTRLMHARRKLRAALEGGKSDE